jgi:Domain of unknown function (DUF4907)
VLAQVEPLPQKDSSYKNKEITFTIFITDSYTYGYNIFINKALFITQSSIPCINGNKGFYSKNDAQKVAMLVVEKIRKGQIPPALTIPELKKLGLIPDQ